MEKDDLLSIYEDNIAKKKERCYTRPAVIATIVVLTLGNVALGGMLLFQPHSDMKEGSDCAIDLPHPAGSAFFADALIKLDYERATQEWINYKESFGKSYATQDSDYAHMWEFLKSQRMIREHNDAFSRGEKSYTLRLNHLSDLLPEEVARLSCHRMDSMFEMNDAKSKFIPPLNADIPDEIDYRDKGYVTPVKNQGKKCGSCYAFGATGALEGQIMRKTGKLISISEQDIIDCSVGYGFNDGCKGGSAADTYLFIRDRGGIESESSYPYTGESDEECAYQEEKSVATDNGVQWIESENEEVLKSAVATQGPIAVAVYAYGNFMKYSTGVFDDEFCNCTTSDLNHAVLIVGYGTDEDTGKDYWIIKNSWSTTWGEDGYMKLIRNKNCMGVAYRPLYPLV